MRLVCISDTHGYYPVLPEGDVLIHCGDFTRRNSHKELHTFAEWFGNQPHKHKILVPGNHDWAFDDSYGFSMKVVGDRFNVLIDKELVIDGVKFYGTPSQPVFYDWAFNHKPSVRKQKYDMIPLDTDILITHTPPLWQLDTVQRGHVGCELLAEAVREVKPQHHIFGHIHESYGISRDGNTQYNNCAMCDDTYELANGPIVFELRPKRKD